MSPDLVVCLCCNAEIVNLLHWHAPRLDFRVEKEFEQKNKICSCCLKLLKVAIKLVLVVCLYAAIQKLQFFCSGMFPNGISGRHMDLLACKK